MHIEQCPGHSSQGDRTQGFKRLEFQRSDNSSYSKGKISKQWDRTKDHGIKEEASC